MDYKEVVKKLFKDKKSLNIILIFFVGIFLVVISSSFQEKEEEKASDTTVYENNVLKETEEKLKNLLLCIDGVENVEVMISFSDMGVKEYYNDETADYNLDKTKTDKKIVFKKYDGNEIPVLKREVCPEIKGVSVIADCTDKNAYDLIFKAVKASLGADSHKIEIIINDRSKK